MAKTTTSRKPNNDWLKGRTILLCLSGSRAYGMAGPDSDVDMHGICIPPKEYVLGFNRRVEQFDKPEHIGKFVGLLDQETRDIAERTKLEGTIYGIHKFFALAKDCNPNLIQLLFSDESAVVLRTGLGERLQAHRNMFLSKVARHRFCGYAMSQLERIKRHRGYLLNPKENRPVRSEFGLPDVSPIKPSQLAAVKAEVGKQLDRWNDGFVGDLEESTKMRLRESLAQLLAELKVLESSRTEMACRKLGFDDNFIQYFQRESEYAKAVAEWESYQHWKSERNADRASLEVKFGYDAKHGAHLVRLMRMAIEILRDGEVLVRRPDAEELLAIRRGEWSYDRIVAYAADMDAEAAELYQTSKLPHAPDIQALDDLCMELVEESMKQESAAI